MENCGKQLKQFLNPHINSIVRSEKGPTKMHHFGDLVLLFCCFCGLCLWLGVPVGTHEAGGSVQKPAGQPSTRWEMMNILLQAASSFNQKPTLQNVLHWISYNWATVTVWQSNGSGSLPSAILLQQMSRSSLLHCNRFSSSLSANSTAEIRPFHCVSVLQLRLKAAQ